MENKGNTLLVMLDSKYLVLGGAPPSTWVPQAQVVETQAQDPSLNAVPQHDRDSVKVQCENIRSLLYIRIKMRTFALTRQLVVSRSVEHSCLAAQ